VAAHPGDDNVNDFIRQISMKNELQVSGMHCGGCELLVKEALEEVDGVSGADVSYLKGTVVVEYEPERVSVAFMTAVIEGQGFTVKA
jgi:copper chaperone